MAYVLFFSGVCFVAGLVGVAANPAPHFGVVGLIVGVAGGCGLLIGFGGSFIGLVLFLIYLGGMLVVFGYSVALAAEPHPDMWLGRPVAVAVFVYVLFVLAVLMVVSEFFMVQGLDMLGFASVQADISGVVLLFCTGGGVLLLCVLGLMLVLFVVLELVRGYGRGSLRVP